MVTFETSESTVDSGVDRFMAQFPEGDEGKGFDDTAAPAPVVQGLDSTTGATGVRMLRWKSAALVLMLAATGVSVALCAELARMLDHISELCPAVATGLAVVAGAHAVVFACLAAWAVALWELQALIRRWLTSQASVGSRYTAIQMVNHVDEVTDASPTNLWACS